jgi:hypothetical protein
MCGLGRYCEVIPYRGTNNLLRICTNIDEQVEDLRVLVNSKQKTINLFPSTKDNDDAFHELLLVKLDDGSQWVIDLTGAQYGHMKSLVPWKKYKRYIDGTKTKTSRFRGPQTEELEAWLAVFGSDVYDDERRAGLHYANWPEYWAEANSDVLAERLWCKQDEFDGWLDECRVLVKENTVGCKRYMDLPEQYLRCYRMRLTELQRLVW